MANAVAVLMIDTEPPIMMSCAEDAGIPKGTVLALSSPFTVAATSNVNDLFGGIAAEEKISRDGKVKIAVYRKGYFKCEAGSNGVTVGLPVVIDDGANEFTNLAADDSDLGYVFGTALESATNGQFFLMQLGTQ